MSAYHHLTELKRAEHIQEHRKVGACLTCKFWDEHETRHEQMASSVAQCVHPELQQQFKLIVSGGSGCNRWERADNIAPDAEDYGSG